MSAFVAVLALVCGESTPGSQAREPAELRVMTFNIRYGTAEDGENHWEKRRELVIDVFRKHAPEVAGVQEALRFQLDEIRAAAPGYAEVGAGRDDGGAKGEYSAILYQADRFELGEHGTFWFSETPERPGSIAWGASLPRICTWAALKLKSGGPWVYVYNVHLDHQSQTSREKSVAQLLAHVRTHAGERPVIVLGDFNATPESAAMRELVAGGWVDACQAGGAAEATFHAWTGVGITRIDYVFAREGMEVLSAAVLRESRDGRFPSDHFPLLAVVRLPVTG